MHRDGGSVTRSIEQGFVWKNRGATKHADGDGGGSERQLELESGGSGVWIAIGIFWREGSGAEAEEEDLLRVSRVEESARRVYRAQWRGRVQGVDRGTQAVSPEGGLQRMNSCWLGCNDRVALSVTRVSC